MRNQYFIVFASDLIFNIEIVYIILWILMVGVVSYSGAVIRIVECFSVDGFMVVIRVSTLLSFFVFFYLLYCDYCVIEN